MTPREELKALADVARANARSAKEMMDEFQNRADALDVIVIHHSDLVCDTLMKRLKKETPSVWPS